MISKGTRRYAEVSDGDYAVIGRLAIRRCVLPEVGFPILMRDAAVDLRVQGK
jgi:hypothetical protein